MAEVTYNVVKPNLYSLENCIFFGVEPGDFSGALQCLDAIVKENIGNLMVPDIDLRLRIGAKENYPSLEERKQPKKFNVPLSKYIETIPSDRRFIEMGFAALHEITNLDATLFNVGYVVHAKTLEESDSLYQWDQVSYSDEELTKRIDTFETNNPTYKTDRTATFEQIKKMRKDLERKLPLAFADLSVINGALSGIGPVSETGPTNLLGRIFLKSIKREGETAIENAKSELLKQLQAFDGPCLSYDAPIIHQEVMNLTYRAKELTNTYGNVLTGDWRSKLFCFDP